MAWGDLREVAGTPAHETLCQRYHDLATAGAMRDLPNPGGLTSAALRDAAAKDADVDEVLAMCRLFQWLLPGLAVNVAFAGAQLSVRTGD